MNNEQANSILTAALSNEQTLLSALTIAAQMFSTGYQSDKQAIADGIAAGVTAATAPLTQQLTDAQTALTAEQVAHQTDNTNNEATIAGLQQQITALQAPTLDTVQPAMNTTVTIQ